MNKHRGMTFMELVVVMALLAMLTMLSVPALTSSQTRQNMNLNIAELKNALVSAQNKAVLEGRVITVHVGTGSTTNSETILSWMPQGSASLMGSETTLYFNPKGYLQNSLSDTGYAGIKVFKVCEDINAATPNSRFIRISRIGHIQDSGVIEGCSE